MFINFVINFIILSQIKRIESLFVSVGDYSNESIPGLNAPECGLSVKPIVIEWSFDDKCFQKKYLNKTFVFFDERISEPQTSNRVFKGMDVRDPSESPWIVWVGARKWWGTAKSCSGVLITPHWVLTAAHCFEDMKNSWFAGVMLSMGSNTKEGKQNIEVKPQSFHSHSLYTNPSIPGRTEPLSKEEQKIIRTRNDIALIKIPGFFPDTTPDNKYFINTICLPKRDEVNDNPENATFYGYGLFNNKSVPLYLQKGTTQLKPFESSDLMFCGTSTKTSASTCLGDSGGPLLQFMPISRQRRAILIGTLWGSSHKYCAVEENESYWVPASKHIDWILKTMKEN